MKLKKHRLCCLKPANILRNVIVKENNDVEISFDKKNIIFKLSEYLMICRQIEARFRITTV